MSYTVGKVLKIPFQQYIIRPKILNIEIEKEKRKNYGSFVSVTNSGQMHRKQNWLRFFSTKFSYSARGHRA